MAEPKTPPAAAPQPAGDPGKKTDHPTTPEYGRTGQEGEAARKAQEGADPRRLQERQQGRDRDLVDLFGRAAALGYVLVPKALAGASGLEPPRGTDAVAGQPDEETRAVLERAAGRGGEPMKAEGKGWYAVTFAGEPVQAVEADSPEQAEQRAMAKLGIRQAGGKPAVQRVQ